MRKPFSLNRFLCSAVKKASIRIKPIEHQCPSSIPHRKLNCEICSCQRERESQEQRNEDRRTRLPFFIERLTLARSIQLHQPKRVLVPFRPSTPLDLRRSPDLLLGRLRIPNLDVLFPRSFGLEARRDLRLETVDRRLRPDVGMSSRVNNHPRLVGRVEYRGDYRHRNAFTSRRCRRSGSEEMASS